MNKERLIDSERDLEKLLVFVAQQKLPFTVKIAEGRMRSIEQNRLQWLWATEAAAYRKDTPVREVQNEWKLNFGVPILCSEDEEFADMWVGIESRLPYSLQLELMPRMTITSQMTSKQLSNYLNQIYQWHVEHGIELTDPEDLRWNAEDYRGMDGANAG